MPFVRPRRTYSRLVLLAIFALAGIAAGGACSLNPQPIPPGAEPDAAFGTPGPDEDPNDKTTGAADATVPSDGGAGGGSDSGSGADAPVVVPAPDAGDAGDAKADALTDAAGPG
jgi:hypothetical protein